MSTTLNAIELDAAALRGEILGPADPGFDDRLHGVKTHTNETLFAFVRAHRPAVTCQNLGDDAIAQALAVDQDAIAIKNDKVQRPPPRQQERGGFVAHPIGSTSRRSAMPSSPGAAAG